MALRWAKGTPREGQRGPIGTQDGARCPQDGLKMSPGRPQRPREPKMIQNGVKGGEEGGMEEDFTNIENMCFSTEIEAQDRQNESGRRDPDAGHTVWDQEEIAKTTPDQGKGGRRVQRIGAKTGYRGSREPKSNRPKRPKRPKARTAHVNLSIDVYIYIYIYIYI